MNAELIHLMDEQHKRFEDEIATKEARKIRAIRERNRGIWFGLGMMGVIGWSVAVPTLVGVLLGVWIDLNYDGIISWTLTLLFLGLAVGCANAWYWVKKGQREIEGDTIDE
jgi:ATP synthase protein I